MKIVIDADACPVVRLTEQIAAKRKIPVLILCDTSHMIASDYSEVVTVEKGSDAVDFALIQKGERGDLAVTQDYGVAAMALGKGMYAIHQSGKEYTNETIDLLLMERHLAKQARKSAKYHGKGPKKRTPEDDKHFAEELERLLTKMTKE